MPPDTLARFLIVGLGVLTGSDASALACSVLRRVPRVERETEVDDPDDDQHQDREHEGELDHAPAPTRDPRQPRARVARQPPLPRCVSLR